MHKIARKVLKEKEKEIKLQRKRADFEGLLTLTNNKELLKWDKKKKKVFNFGKNLRNLDIKLKKEKIDKCLMMK